MAIKKYHVSKNLYENNADDYRNGQYVNGEWQDTPSRITSQFIPVEGGKQYNITVSGQVAALINFNFFDTNNIWLGNRSTQGLEPATTTQTEWYTNVLPSNAAFLCFTYSYYGDRSLSISAADMIPLDIMVNEGSTALPYEPYGNTWQSIPYKRYENGEWVEYNDKKYESGQWT